MEESAAVVKSLVVKTVEEAALVLMATKEAVAAVGVVVLDLLVPDLQLYAVEVTTTNELSSNVVSVLYRA